MPKKDRESADDIRKYLPDAATILKRADPAYSDKIFREAMNNPELDEAIRERDRAVAEREARAPTESSPEAAPPAGDTQPARVSAPSPWAKDAPGLALDAAALPSANAPEPPAAAPPVTAPIHPVTTKDARPEAPRRLPKWVFPAVMVLALAPLAMWAVVSRLPPHDAGTTVPTASAKASASGIADSATAPSVQTAAPPPSSAPTTSAAVPPAATSAPSTGPSATPRPNHGHPEPRPHGAVEDPYDSGTPAPPKTVEPVAPPPLPKTAEPVAPQAPTAAPDPFLDKRPR